jgi:carbon storage regulator
MLLLTWKAGQCLRIGEVTVKVLSTKGNTVRIGIDAPQDIAVQLDEISEQVRAVAERLPEGGTTRSALPPVSLRIVRSEK